MKHTFNFKQFSFWNRCTKMSLILIPAFSVLALGHIQTTSVDADSTNCSYKNVSPTSNTVVNHVQKCLTLEDGSDDIYTLTYKFKVTGISNAATK